MADDLESKLIVREGDIVAVVNPRIARIVHNGIKLLTTDEPLLETPEVEREKYRMERYMIARQPDRDSLIPVSTDDSGKPTSKFPNRLASEMLYGFFGEFGYVDIIQQRGSPRLVGIVHIPKKLVYLIGALEGDQGLERFYQEFCREQEGDRWTKHRWNLQAHQTEFDKNVLKALPIADEQFYWKIQKLESDVFKDDRPLHEQLADYQSTVREFITRLDNHVIGLRPGASPADKITPDMARKRFESVNSGNAKYFSTGDFSGK